METETIKNVEEVVKVASGMNGKLSWEIRLTGAPEDNLKRISSLKKELDLITKKEA